MAFYLNSCRKKASQKCIKGYKPIILKKKEMMITDFFSEAVLRLKVAT